MLATYDIQKVSELIMYLFRPQGSGTRWPFTGVSRALRARNPKEVWKKSPGPQAPGPPPESGKSLERVFPGPYRDFFQTLETFSRLFPDSRGPQGRRPRETLFTSSLANGFPTQRVYSLEVLETLKIPETLQLLEDLNFLELRSLGLWAPPVHFQSRFSGRGCDEALFSEKKGGFQWKGGGNSVNGGFGKGFYRKGNSVKRSGRFSEPPDSEKWKVAVLIPFPKISSYIFPTR